MSFELENIFESIPENTEKEVFSEILTGRNIVIRRIVSQGQSSPESGWYDQEENEWVIVLKGEGKILFESGDVHHLIKGGYLNIPAHTKHKVLWTSPAMKTIWLAVYYK